MFVKSLEKSQFRCVKVASFEISLSDVEKIYLDMGIKIRFTSNSMLTLISKSWTFPETAFFLFLFFFFAIIAFLCEQELLQNSKFYKCERSLTKILSRRRKSRRPVYFVSIISKDECTKYYNNLEKSSIEKNLLHDRKLVS